MGVLSKRTLRTLHNWTGLSLSVVLIVLTLSGILLIYKDDYLRASIPSAATKLSYSPEQFAQAIVNIEKNTKNAPISYIVLANDLMSLHKVVFKDGTVSYADQSGNIIKTWEINGSLEDWIFHLHHYLFLDEFGKLLSGVVGFLAIFMVVTGLILVWPSLRKFKWRIFPRTLKKSALMAQHRELGIVFSLPIILLTFTGASMVYSTPAQVLLAGITISGTSEFVKRPLASAGVINWSKALIQAQKEFPTGRLRIISRPKTDSSPVSIRLKQTDEWHQNGRTYVYVNPSTSEILAVKDALKKTRAERGFNMLYPVHSIAVGGRIFDIIATLTGLALIVLALVASLTFIQRLRR